MPKKTAKKKPASKKRAKRVAAKRVAAKKPAPRLAAPPMPKGPNAIPDGLTSVTPNLVLKECARAIEFYQRAFDAKVLASMPTPDGKGIWHAALQIGNAQVFVNDPDPGNQSDYREPSGQLWVYGPDVDARYQRAVDAGAKPTMPLWDAFWGDRFGMVVDPFGQIWTLAERKKNLSPEETAQAGAAFAAATPHP